MNKMNSVFLTTLIFALVLAACGAPSPAATPTTRPTETLLPPTATATLVPTATATPKLTARPLPIYAIQIYADGSGWGTNIRRDTIYHTSDYAQTWVNATPSDAASPVGQSFPTSIFYDGQTAWLGFTLIETSSTLYRTTDAGKTWAKYTLNFPGGLMSFNSPTDGYMLATLGVGAGSEYVAIYHTQDGGATWEQKFTHTPGGAAQSLPGGGLKGGFAFTNSGTGWISGSEPISDFLYLFTSTDQGSTWAETTCNGIPSDSGQGMWDAGFFQIISPSEIVLPIHAFILSDTQKTYFCSTTDAGKTWNYLSELPPLNGFSFAPDGSGLAFNPTSLFVSTDAAKTWKDLSANLPQQVAVIAASAVDAKLIYIVTSHPSLEYVDQNTIYVSRDGGQSWDLVPAVLQP